MVQQTSKLYFSITYFGNYLVLQLPQCLNSRKAIDFKESCSELIKKTKQNQTIILDLSRTQFIDDSGIEALVYIHIISRAYQHKLIFQQVSPLIMAFLKIAGLTEIFQFSL